jgi:hypothetical protein
MKAINIVMLAGWFFLILSWIWPSNKWGSHTIKIALSALSTGLFIANAIHALVK